jgi:hypothetical protein
MPNKSDAHFLFKNDLNKNHSIYRNTVSNVQVDKRLFLGNPKVNVDERNVIDYKKIPIIDPERLKNKLEDEERVDEFLRTVNKVMEKKPSGISAEAKNADRLKMEQTVLGSIGFGKKASTASMKT